MTGVQTCALPISVAGTLFFQQVAGNYHDVQVIPPEARQVGPQPALIYGGIGNNAKNTQIRFLAITVRSEERRVGKECRL